MIETPSSPQAARSRTLQGTDLLALGWVVATVYACLHSLFSPGKEPGIGLAATVITLAVAWSVLERKRWGRLALIGIAIAACVDAVRDALVALGPRPAGERLPHYTADILRYAWNGHYGPLFLALSVGSIYWLLRRPVQQEFDRRKRGATWRFQIGIAVVLVAAWILAATSIL